MGYDDHRALRRTGDLAEKIHHDLAVLRIQRGGRLVADHQRRLVHQGAGDGDPLLLATGKLVGPLIPALADADPIEDLTGTFQRLAAGYALDQQGNPDVFRDRERGDEVELLENEADALRPEAGERSARHFFQRIPENLDPAALNAHRSGDGAQQRRFPAAGRADEHHDLTGARLQVHLLEHVDAVRPIAEALFGGADIDNDAVGGWRVIRHGRPWRVRRS